MGKRATEPKAGTIQVTVSIDEEIIRGLLCSAFEGGSNYWARLDRVIMPPGAGIDDYCKGGKRQPSKTYWHHAQIIPLEEGGALIFRTRADDEVDGKRSWRLDRNAIAAGCAVMAAKYPKHWGDALAETGDAITGDVFLQCCLFGKTVFG